jgi:hypothetical protein
MGCAKPMGAQVRGLLWIGQDKLDRERQDGAPWDSTPKAAGDLTFGVWTHSSIRGPQHAAYTEQPTVEGNPHRGFQIKISWMDRPRAASANSQPILWARRSCLSAVVTFERDDKGAERIVGRLTKTTCGSPLGVCIGARYTAFSELELERAKRRRALGKPDP